jgi:hypothetical protein
MKDKNYAVGLVKLSASQFLGDNIRAKYYEVMEDAVESLLPMHLLIHFLKNGKHWIKSKQDSDIPRNREFPPFLCCHQVCGMTMTMTNASISFMEHFLWSSRYIPWAWENCSWMRSQSISKLCGVISFG